MVTTRYSSIPTYRSLTVVGSVLTIERNGEVRIALCSDSTSRTPITFQYAFVPSASLKAR